MNHQVVDIVSRICQKDNTREYIGLHEPDFTDTSAWEYVKECIDSGWVSSAGKWVNEIEKQICEITGAREAVAVTNGTVALRLALHVVGVKPGDEVIMPSMSFVATANAASHLGAYPHFVDIEEKTLGIDIDNSSYNINADTAAGFIAGELKASKLLLLTDVAGIMDSNNKLISTLNISEAKKIMNESFISGGMVPKIQTCINAMEKGVNKSTILDGRIPHSVILELFTEHGIGTQLVSN